MCCFFDPLNAFYIPTVCKINFQMKRTKEEAGKTKERILKCAVQAFIEKGFEKTSLTYIAGKSGLTKGAIFWHFRDKSAILDEIIELYDREAIDYLPNVVAAELSPLMKIKFLVYAYVPEFRDKKRLANLFRLKSEISNHYRMRNRQPFAMVFINKLEELFRQAMESGEVKKNVDPHVTSLTVSLIITGTYIRYDVDPAFFSKLDHLEDIMNDYFSLISTAKGSSATANHRETVKQLFPKLTEY